jgi:uncharacterized membrane protein YgcG
MENGHGAFLAWTSHYNGQGELSKHMAMAKARIKSLFYKNEHSLLFEKVMEILSKSFSTLDKNLDERYLECQKVEKLLQCICMQMIFHVGTACNYLHGGAQLENSKYTKKHNVLAMYGCSGGRGHFGGRGRLGGHGGGCSGGQGGGGNDRSNFINGVDVLDLTQNFIDEEWRKLVYNGGWVYVAPA